MYNVRLVSTETGKYASLESGMGLGAFHQESKTARQDPSPGSAVFVLRVNVHWNQVESW